ncbi:MAG: fumarylacetoacetate hydrolase family protein [Flavobacteriales bacterium]
MKLEELAQLLDDAAMAAKPIAQLSHDNDFTLDEAYEIQRLAIQRRIDRGEKMIGLKMGFTSEAKMIQMGVHDMIWGLLTDSMLIENEGEANLAKYIHPRAEPEVCFRISKDIDGEIALDDLDEYVDGIAAAIEIIDSRFENFKFSLEDVVADNCSSTGLVIGEWQTPSRNIANLKMTQSFDGLVVAEGSSADILGDPWKSLQAATRLAAKYGRPIKAGYVIMAGAATAAEFLKPNSSVTAEVERLGEVSFKAV